jgi:TonB-linked SusC/RagA family outer membrane protein
MFHSLLYRSSRVLALAALTLFLGASTAFAQQSRVEGTVRHAQTRDPVENARVSVVGTNLFAVTNVNGYYAIENVPVGTYDVRVQVIGFQSVVYTNQRVAAGLPTTVNFQLQPSILRIEGVVVTGVAEATQAVKLPFTVEQIAGEELPVAMQTAEEAIRGKVAGARVIRGEGTPGGGVTVLLRGATTLTGSNEPLYVVDGVILGQSMVDIDALDIANIEVVKGAAASALYGARAANGVISIETRRGSEVPDGETQITLRSEFGRSDIENPIRQAQSHFFRLDGAGNWLGETASGADSAVSPDDRAYATRVHSWSPVNDVVTDSTDWDGDGSFTSHSYVIRDNPYTGTTYDNLDRFFSPGSFYTNTIGVSHRTGSTNFRASFHQTKESGAVEGQDGYLRRGGRVNVDHRIGSAFDFHASGYYSQSIADDPQGGENAFYGLNFYPIDVDLLELYPDTLEDWMLGSGLPTTRRDSNDFLINPDPSVVESNPIYSARNNYIDRVRGRLLGSVGLRWRPSDIFDIEGNFSYDRSDRTTTTYFFKGFRTTDASTLNQGRLQKDQGVDQAINANINATFHKSFGDLSTLVKARALLERQDGENFFSRAQNLVVDNVLDLDVGDQDESRVGSSSDDVRSLGYFLSTQFDYKGRYISDFVLRRDGSSLFGADQRWHWYYRVSGAYRVSQENWWPFDFMNEFKLRYSRGTAGGRPSFSAQYETFSVSGGNVSKGNLGNKLLKPEKATEQEFGVDMIVLGRVSVGITYARSLVEDQLLEVPLAGFYGYGNQWRNAGTLNSRTWEGTVQAAIVQTPDIGWNVNFVIDRTRQNITEFNLPAYRTGPGSVWYLRDGEILGTMYGDKWATTCAEVLTDGGFGAACDQFQVNDDGYLVAVGTGNSYTDGIDQNYYGSNIEIDGESFAWGFPIKAKVIAVDTLPGGQIFTDTTEFQPMGNSVPDFNFGIGNTFRWKGLSLYALFDAQIGGDVYNNTRQWAMREYNAWEADQSDKPENQRKPLDYYGTLYNVNSNNSHYVEDATFVKLRELSLSYAFNRGQLENLLGGFMKRVSLSLVGRNLLTWTDYTGYDPEVSEGGNAAIYRFDGFEYPNYRTVSGAVEIQF